MKIRSLIFALVLSSLSALHAAPLELHKGDNVAIVGSGLADRQQHLAWLETLIHKAYPDLELTVRNLGFAADEVNVHPRSDEVPTIEQFLNMKPGTTTLTVGPGDFRHTGELIDRVWSGMSSWPPLLIVIFPKSQSCCRHTWLLILMSARPLGQVSNGVVPQTWAAARPPCAAIAANTAASMIIHRLISARFI